MPPIPRMLAVLLLAAGATIAPFPEALASDAARDAGAAPAPVRTCESLASLRLPQATITTAEAVTSGTFSPPADKPLTGLPAFCRVAGVIRPTSDSQIEIEVWMPAAGWNRKLQGVGNGGFAGSISYDGLAEAVRRGYAAASTDTGHKGSGIDATWALGHPEKIVDFGHRAIHEMTVKAKAVVAGLLRRGPATLVLRLVLERRPAGADGSAALPRRLRRHRRRRAGRGVDDDHVRASSGTRRRWPIRQRTFLPRSCRRSRRRWSRPATRATACRTAWSLCRRRAGSTRARPCARRLTRRSASPVPRPRRSRRSTPVSAGADGRVLAPGFLPGAETGPGGLGALDHRRGAGPEPADGLRHPVRRQHGVRPPGLGPEDVRLRQGPEGRRGEAREGPQRHRSGPRGVPQAGRQADPLPRLERRRAAAARARSTTSTPFAPGWGATSPDSFVRLYMMPGLQHCFGGPGAHYCGGLAASSGDAERDFSAALERWVEDGVAPGTMVAVKPRRPRRRARGPGARAAMTRPLCPYPQAAVFKGAGSPDDPAGYRCETP